MSRYPALTMEQIGDLFAVDVSAGRVVWKCPPKNHPRMKGQEAGCPRESRGKRYWHIKVERRAYRRAQIVLAVMTGLWPAECVDHINGDSLDDRGANLRHATVQQNAWNHKTRRKVEATPMGVRAVPSGHYEARITVDKRQRSLGLFNTMNEASVAYQQARKQHFNVFAGEPA